MLIVLVQKIDNFEYNLELIGTRDLYLNVDEILRESNLVLLKCHEHLLILNDTVRQLLLIIRAFYSGHIFSFCFNKQF